MSAAENRNWNWPESFSESTQYQILIESSKQCVEQGTVHENGQFMAL
jgi:hypothetical protein